MNYLDILNRGPVKEVYEVVGEWELWIGEQQVKVKVTKNIDGQYFYTTSHFYHGSRQASPYISSVNRCSSIEEALRNAHRQLTSFYEESDEQKIWVPNSNY